MCRPSSVMHHAFRFMLFYNATLLYGIGDVFKLVNGYKIFTFYGSNKVIFLCKRSNHVANRHFSIPEYHVYDYSCRRSEVNGGEQDFSTHPALVLGITVSIIIVL